QQREIMRSSVKPIFTFEPRRGEEAVQNFRAAWERLQRGAEQSGNKANGNVQKEATWTGPGGAEIGRVLLSRRFTSNDIDYVQRLQREQSSGAIYSDQYEQFLQGEVEIVDRQRPTDTRQAGNPLSTMTSLTRARDKFRAGLD